MNNRKKKTNSSKIKKESDIISESLQYMPCNQRTTQYYKRMETLQKHYENDKSLMASFNKNEVEEDERSEDRNLAHASLTLNILSLFGNLFASALSGSLSILSLFIDSSMDISCSLVMNICLSLIQKPDSFNYPRGRERLEVIGAMLCAILMVFANVVMIFQSIYSIIEDTPGPVMNTVTFSILAAQTSLKAVLCYLCYKRNSTSSLVIAMDLRNDIATRLLALVFATFGDHIWKYADSLGAVLVCSIIAILWIKNAIDTIPTLIGKSSDGDNVSRILKIALDHDSRIRYIDHVMVYHTGERALVELHIVMDENLPLKVTHDISHPLEKKLQRLPFVERVFVHCDYYCDGD